MSEQTSMATLISWISPYQDVLPWLLLGLVLGIVLIFFIRRSIILQKQLLSCSTDQEAASQELILFKERLSCRDVELERQRTDSETLIASLTAERDLERLHYEDLAREHSRLQADLASEKTKILRIKELTEERDSARTELEKIRGDKNILDTDFAALQSKLDEERKSAQEKIAMLEQAEQRLTKEFENLANRIFDEKHQKFNEASKTSVEALLSPVRQQLTDFRKKVEDVYDNENKERASLRAEINILKSLNERIGTDALNLTKALKGDSKTRGNWGEMLLERLLEESGLRKDHEIQSAGQSSQ